jgi:hypothetical protein
MGKSFIDRFWNGVTIINLKNELSKKGQVVIPNKSLKSREKIVFS